MYFRTVFLMTNGLSLNDLLITTLTHQDVILEVEHDFNLLDYLLFIC